ncbi:MAG: CBS domain-containing protein [Aggregatilineales bacterium]
MIVSEIMTAKPVTLHQNQPLRTALEILSENSFHHLPILNSEGQLVGILTERDCRAALKSPFILRETWQNEDLVTRLPVRAIMTPAPIVVEPDADADDAVRLMLDYHISCLPVVRSETLVGIITTSDVLAAFRQMYRRVRMNG